MLIFLKKGTEKVEAEARYACVYVSVCVWNGRDKLLKKSSKGISEDKNLILHWCIFWDICMNKLEEFDYKMKWSLYVLKA